MATKTDIANLAVSCHQGGWLQNVESDPGAMAEALRATWTQAREEALGAHPWKFARRTYRQQNAVSQSENPSDRRFFYRLPPDCIRVYRIPPGIDFDEWEGGIGCDEGPTLDFIGINGAVEIGRQTPDFNKYLAFLWAWYICTAVNASEAIRTRCLKDYRDALADARHDDSKVGTIQRPTADSFVNARLGGFPGPSTFR